MKQEVLNTPTLSIYKNLKHENLTTVFFKNLVEYQCNLKCKVKLYNNIKFNTENIPIINQQPEYQDYDDDSKNVKNFDLFLVALVSSVKDNLYKKVKINNLIVRDINDQNLLFTEGHNLESIAIIHKLNNPVMGIQIGIYGIRVDDQLDLMDLKYFKNGEYSKMSQRRLSSATNLNEEDCKLAILKPKSKVLELANYLGVEEDNISELYEKPNSNLETLDLDNNWNNL